MNKEEQKKIYIVATPIGNLEDISHRAIRILSEVDVVLCEDTRVTGKLLKHYKISSKLESYHAHSHKNKEQKILDNIESGVVYALVSDAGTPTISDPGVKLIHEIYKKFGNNVDVVSIPGPTALITALSSSGFMGNQFTFYGFLPHKKGRNKIFTEIFESNRIGVFYESPHRIMKTLQFIHENYHDSGKKICVARELTKMYEEKVIGDISTVFSYFKNNEGKVMGEFVVIIDKP
ncbi:MAG: 16S rRNA (cytidine(1402)-2'-O)-methyltransferase [Candidatus Pacebacteria bacterium]|nr:16S rRNA (cytidine(1402)-2'-O)-methyltransferase [Candidatus Paceibacterota bacterium]